MSETRSSLGLHLNRPSRRRQKHRQAAANHTIEKLVPSLTEEEVTLVRSLSNTFTMAGLKTRRQAEVRTIPRSRGIQAIRPGAILPSTASPGGPAGIRPRARPGFCRRSSTTRTCTRPRARDSAEMAPYFGPHLKAVPRSRPQPGSRRGVGPTRLDIASRLKPRSGIACSCVRARLAAS